MSVGAVNKQTGDRIPTAGMPAIDSVLSGVSTNPVQNRVVKAALDEKADTDMVAADFNAGTSYTAGNYCVQDGKLYKFKNNHSGAWSSADVDEVKITGELATLKSGLTNLGNATNLGVVQGSDTITLSDSVANYRFVQILVGYYGSGYPCLGLALLPVSTIAITTEDIPITLEFTSIDANPSGRVNVSFLSATAVKVVNTIDTVYTKLVGIA